MEYVYVKNFNDIFVKWKYKLEVSLINKIVYLKNMPFSMRSRRTYALHPVCFSTVLSSQTAHIYPYLPSHSSWMTQLITTDAVIPAPTKKATVEVEKHVEAMTHWPWYVRSIEGELGEPIVATIRFPTLPDTMTSFPSSS